jgi:hypothetical protein
VPAFTHVDLLPEPLVHAARALFGVNRVAFVGFVTESAGPEPYWFLEHTLEGTRIDLGRLLRSRALEQVCPDLATRVNPDRMFSFSEVEPLALIPLLAGALAAGDPRGVRLPMTEAHDLASNFVNSQIGSSLDGVVVLHSRACWSDWFACDAWDQTWVIARRDGSGVTLLCLTGGHPPGRP